MNLSDKTILITDDEAGVGKYIARGAAHKGATVILAGTGYAKTSNCGITRNGDGSIDIRETDLTDKQQLEDLVADVVSKYFQMDVLITAAKYLKEISILNTLEDEWDKTMDKNLTSPLYAVQAVLPYMIAQRSGKIVIVTSTASLRGRCDQVGFCAAAGALTAFAANTAVQVGKYGINVNCIASGIIDNPAAKFQGEKKDYTQFRIAHSPLRRIGTPKDIVGPALFLSGSESDFITGETITVDGGISIYTNGYGLQEGDRG